MNNEQKIQSNNPGMYDWFLAQQKDGSINVKETEKLLKENEEKQERLRAYQLPTFATTGTCSSLEEATSLIPENKWGVEKFLIRCLPKNNDDNLNIQRARNINLDEVTDFINNLPNGRDKYSVEIREHWEPDYAGTIISDGNGSTVIEQVKGTHANIENQSVADSAHNIKDGIKKIAINANSFDLHFTSQEQPTPEEKDIMIGALKYFTPEISRENLEKLKIYTEYCFSKKHGYRFIDIANSNYWTTLHQTKKERQDDY